MDDKKGNIRNVGINAKLKKTYMPFLFDKTIFNCMRI